MGASDKVLSTNITSTNLYTQNFDHSSLKKAISANPQEAKRLVKVALKALENSETPLTLMQKDTIEINVSFVNKKIKKNDNSIGNLIILLLLKILPPGEWFIWKLEDQRIDQIMTPIFMEIQKGTLFQLDPTGTGIGKCVYRPNPKKKQEVSRRQKHI